MPRLSRRDSVANDHRDEGLMELETSGVLDGGNNGSVVGPVGFRTASSELIRRLARTRRVPVSRRGDVACFRTICPVRRIDRRLLTLRDTCLARPLGRASLLLALVVAYGGVRAVLVSRHGRLARVRGGRGDDRGRRRVGDGRSVLWVRRRVHRGMQREVRLRDRVCDAIRSTLAVLMPRRRRRGVGRVWIVVRAWIVRFVRRGRRSGYVRCRS